MDHDLKKAEFLNAQLDKLAKHLESLRIADYMELLQRPARLIMVNFVAGIARGFGIAIGATLVFALMLDVLRRIIMLHIPGIGEFVAEIMRIVDSRNGKF
jgi:spore maturation protein SpmB